MGLPQYIFIKIETGSNAWGILAAVKKPTIHFPISFQDTSNKIVPMICTLLTDPEKPVREQAFKVAKGFIQKLEQVKWNTYCHPLLKSIKVPLNLASVCAWALALKKFITQYIFISGVGGSLA